MNSIGANDVMAPPAADLIAPSLKTRVKSAAVLLPIVVAFLYVGLPTFEGYRTAESAGANNPHPAAAAQRLWGRSQLTH